MARLPHMGKSAATSPQEIMIPNHAQFIEAIRDRKLIRIVYYSRPDAGTVDRECAPLDYGLELGSSDGLNRYWIWDPAGTAGSNPLGLAPDQIVNVFVLGKDFDKDKLLEGIRPPYVLHDWSTQPELPDQPTPAAMPPGTSSPPSLA